MTSFNHDSSFLGRAVATGGLVESCVMHVSSLWSLYMENPTVLRGKSMTHGGGGCLSVTTPPLRGDSAATCLRGCSRNWAFWLTTGAMQLTHPAKWPQLPVPSSSWAKTKGDITFERVSNICCPLCTKTDFKTNRCQARACIYGMNYVYLHESH